MRCTAFFIALGLALALGPGASAQTYGSGVTTSRQDNYFTTVGGLGTASNVRFGTLAVGTSLTASSTLTAGTATGNVAFVPNDGQNKYSMNATGNLDVGFNGSGAFRILATATPMITVNSTVGTSHAGTFAIPGVAAGSGATTGTLCWTTSTGNVTVNTTVACLSSDERLKDIAAGFPDAGALVRGLKPIVYKWKAGTPKTEADPGEHLGLGAFTTGYVDDRLIGRDAEGNPSGWRQDAMIALLVANAQEQRGEIDRQQIYILLLFLWCGMLSAALAVVFVRRWS